MEAIVAIATLVSMIVDERLLFSWSRDGLLESTTADPVTIGFLVASALGTAVEAVLKGVVGEGVKDG